MRTITFEPGTPFLFNLARSRARVAATLTALSRGDAFQLSQARREARIARRALHRALEVKCDC